MTKETKNDNTSKSTKNKENKKTSEKKTEVIQENQTDELKENNTSKTNKSKPKLKLIDDMVLNVESTTFGTLIFANSKNGDKVKWMHEGDIQQISVESVRFMKSNQIRFFEKNWVRLISIADDGYDKYTSKDIYEALMLQKYIKNSELDIEDLILNHPDKINYYIEKMGNTFKTSVTVKCNDMIDSQKLDSFSLIRKLEGILNCELRNLEN
ncbi:hypothetical protein CWE04_11800 [Thomasclavelia cocleata]|uniref:Uncharacterized protein n=1 Tax=Thomasclavelia cocleata TaxID=69824 RepID=A0A1I0BJG0_9FIRM|nr:hypothetical protein [Thomasclavelia cocleata]MCR1960213.1 hypothetical protein [Thomasclavelia cocleata]NDO41813.1 hypothetical protein [Thomasclavelia cocleata]PJN79886.1 hypothetical protein CWE04_11800 [Thomasclavelia cocleata]SET07147.1 hypothetical protein SAMN04489758_101152 [Thomasclavelia cocleata]